MGESRSMNSSRPLIAVINSDFDSSGLGMSDATKFFDADSSRDAISPNLSACAQRIEEPKNKWQETLRINIELLSDIRYQRCGARLCVA